MIPYILHVAIFLTASLLFYKAVLQKLTFYKLNRLLLLACLLASFVLPLVQIPQEWTWQETMNTEEVNRAVYNIPHISTKTLEPTIINQTPTVNSRFTWATFSTWLVYFYWFGVIAFGINFLVQLAVLLRRMARYPSIQDGPYRIVEITGDKAPCSFGNCIFINPEKYDWETYCQILEHEKIHVAQRHSFDLLLTELVLVFQWFNPFAWMYRKTVEDNLEFLTDGELITQPTIEKTSYQMSLLKVSAPHFPLSLTTNYNQSLLKKRLVMMNAKRSSINATWKYLFLLPVFVAAMCLLNKPMVYGQVTAQKEKEIKPNEKSIMATEGQWFADIRATGVQMLFKKDGYTGDGTNGTVFLLEELKDLPRDKEGSFSIKREAGTIEFTGKFEGAQGNGRYRFLPDLAYQQKLEKEGLDPISELDQMTFFFVNLRTAYIQELKALGYTALKKGDLIPLAALDVSAAYIRSITGSGFQNLRLHDLVAFKSLGINDQYIQGIRKAGYPNVTPNQVIQFKAAGLDQKTIEDIRPLTQPKKDKEGHPEAVANHTDRQVPSFSREAVSEDASTNDFTTYARSLTEAGLQETPLNKIIQMKHIGITAAYVRQWIAVGYTDIRASDLMGLISTGVTPDFVTKLKQAGLTNVSLGNVMGIKNMGITPELVKEYQSLGFSTISAGNILAAQATGVTPAFIKSMRDKGYNLSLSKYIDMRSAMAKGHTQ